MLYSITELKSPPALQQAAILVSYLSSAVLHYIQSTLGNSAIFTAMQWMLQIYLTAVLQIHLRKHNLDIYKVMNLEQLNNHPGQKKGGKKSQRYSDEMHHMGREKIKNRTISLIVNAKLQTQH